MYSTMYKEENDNSYRQNLERKGGNLMIPRELAEET